MHIAILKNDASAIDATVKTVTELAFKPEDTRPVRAFALMIIAGTKTPDEAAQRLFTWVRQHIKYQFDPRNREFVQRPLFLLQHGARRTHLAAGDCDDHAAVQLALASSLGYKMRIVLTENPETPGPSDDPWWEHIHVEMEVEPNRWRPMDSSLEFLQFGERATGSRRKYIDPEALGGHILDGRPSLGFMDIFTKGVGMITDITVGIISGEATKKAGKWAAHASAMSSQAEAHYLEEQARLNFEGSQLALERLDAARREAETFAALEKQSRRGAMMPLYVAGSAALAVFAYTLWRKYR